jgi:hypothetical protein
VFQPINQTTSLFSKGMQRGICPLAKCGVWEKTNLRHQLALTIKQKSFLQNDPRLSFSGYQTRVNFTEKIKAPANDMGLCRLGIKPIYVFYTSTRVNKAGFIEAKAL